MGVNIQRGSLGVGYDTVLGPRSPNALALNQRKRVWGRLGVTSEFLLRQDYHLSSGVQGQAGKDKDGKRKGRRKREEEGMSLRLCLVKTYWYQSVNEYFLSTD